MKWIAVLLLAAANVSAEPLVLINTLPDRPVFNLVTRGVVQSRSVAPFNRVTLEPGTFSGVGIKAVPLAGGQIYYLARFGALASLYVLPPDQVLILNQSGQSVDLAMGGESALLASGGVALGSASDRIECAGQIAQLEGGRVYRVLLTSPDGIGTAVTLNAW